MAGPDQPPLFHGASSGKRRGRPPGSKNKITGERRRPGRVERALAGELRESQLPEAVKAHLRAAAAFVDTAEAGRAVADGTKAVLAYLQLRQAYGLAGNLREPLDPFAAFVAGLAAPSVGDTENS